MYHGGWTIAVGGVKALTRTAKLLGKIDMQMAELLAEVTGEDADELNGCHAGRGHLPHAERGR